MGIFISVEKTIECVIIALCYGVLLTLAAGKILGALQAVRYSNLRLFGWLKKRGNMCFTRLALLGLLCFLSAVIVALCFSFAGGWAALISLIPMAAFMLLYVYADTKIALRVPAAVTKRFIRLRVVLFLVCAIVTYILVTLLNFADYVWGQTYFGIIKYSILAIMPLILIALVCLANLIAKIYETPHNKNYVKKATQKVASSGICVVGITGSYGKTTTKKICAAMLAKKYRVLSTPRSYNTPIGIALAVNANKLSDYDIFIAEMGAKNIGDIAELCAICPPDYSIITGICPQHLETFESIENIVSAKGEILTSTKKRAYIAKDCEEYFAGYGVERGVCDVVTDVVSDCNGTQFTLTLGGQSRRVTTKLLGVHCAYNIALAASLAYDLGVSIDDITAACAELDYIEHRLQLIQTGGINILDDGYNANVKGARAALEVLRTFGGKKVAVTPGMVELGILEESENKALGALLVGLDMVILVGDTLIAPVKEGYLAAGGDAEKLAICATLHDAEVKLQGVLEKGDTVLFLNDLPDIY